MKRMTRHALVIALTLALAPGAALAQTAPARQPNPVERRARIVKIRELAKSKDKKDQAALEAIVTGRGPAYERAAALEAIGDTKREHLMPALRGLVDDTHLTVRIEAVVTMYRWGYDKVALPLLAKLRDQGIPLRRAFRTGFKDGRATYDRRAKAFLQGGLGSDNPYVRLDAAMGLFELGEEAAGLGVFTALLKTEKRANIRLAAVNYLGPIRTAPAVRALLQTLTSDADPKLVARAEALLK